VEERREGGKEGKGAPSSSSQRRSGIRPSLSRERRKFMRAMREEGEEEEGEEEGEETQACRREGPLSPLFISRSPQERREGWEEAKIAWT